MERRIIDVHHHLNPPTDETADRTAEECSRLGIVKRALLGMPPKCDPKANAAVLAAARTYPDLFLPFAAPDMDDAAPDDVTRFKDRGYVGLKFIVPSRPYNDPAYFPLYERACDLKMPVLFHLGIVANRPGYPVTEVPEEVETVVITPIEVSSDDIRRRLKAGRSIRYLVPEKVRNYIVERNLYK